MEIGSQIRRLRLLKGITQETLAQALHVSPQAISKWETQQTLPDILLLPNISAYFGVTLDELFDVTDELHLERIQNMLWDERTLHPDTARKDLAFLAEHANRNPHDAKALTLMAEMENHHAKEHRRQAAEYAKAALDRDPRSKQAHGELVEASGGRMSDWYVANHHDLINWYQGFVAQHPDYRSGYLWLMDQLLDDQRFEEASAYAEKLSKVDDSFRTLLYRGHIAWLSGNQSEAARLWQSMTEQHGDDWLVWLSMGDILARAGRLEDAKQHYRRALETQPEPKYVDSLESIAQVCERQGLYADAISALEEEIIILAEQWNTLKGETVDRVRREIERLDKAMTALDKPKD